MLAIAKESALQALDDHLARRSLHADGVTDAYHSRSVVSPASWPAVALALRPDVATSLPNWDGSSNVDSAIMTMYSVDVWPQTR
jgi:hypothetical protein